MALDTSASGLIALGAVLTALIFICVPLRFRIRRKQDAKLLADDYLMLAASLAFVATAIVLWIGIHKKIFGYLTDDFTAAELEARAKTSAVLQILIDIFSILCLGCTKASAVLFYLRIFCTAGYKGFRAILTLTVSLIACWVITFEILTGLQCGTHFAALWNGNYRQDCTITFDFLYGLIISDVLLDIWVLSLPIPKVLVLHATIQKRLSIIGVFLIGLAALAAGLARMVIFVQVESTGQTKYAHLPDPEAVLSKEAFFIVLEAGLSSLAINMISLWPFLSKTAPEAILRGARSLASLASGSSRNTSDSKKAPNAADRVSLEILHPESAKSSSRVELPANLHSADEVDDV